MIYRVGYIAYDGTKRTFKFESDKRLVSNSTMCIMTNPLFDEVLREFAKRSSDSNNKMHKHGGARTLTFVERVDTGHIELFDWPVCCKAE